MHVGTRIFRTKSTLNYLGKISCSLTQLLEVCMLDPNKSRIPVPEALIKSISTFTKLLCLQTNELRRQAPPPPRILQKQLTPAYTSSYCRRCTHLPATPAPWPLITTDVNTGVVKATVGRSRSRLVQVMTVLFLFSFTRVGDMHRRHGDEHCALFTR